MSGSCIQQHGSFSTERQFSEQAELVALADLPLQVQLIFGVRYTIHYWVPVWDLVRSKMEYIGICMLRLTRQRLRSASWYLLFEC